MSEHRILIADDEKVQRDLLAGALRKDGYHVVTVPSGDVAVETVRREDFDVALLDLKMPGISGIEAMQEIHKVNPEIAVIIITAFGTVDTAVQSIREGAYDYITKPVDLTKLRVQIKRGIENRILVIENRYLKEELKDKYGFDNIIGESKEIESVLSIVSRVSKSGSTVLITGESGTGKEVIARAIHYAGSASSHRFVPVACAALPETLLEAELFGCEKGAFTGATKQRKGRFEIADEGTIFLDEIGDVPVSVQVKLLRVLQEQTFERVGSNESISVRTRVISATNQDLEQKIKDGTFREDLYYRLNVVAINVPPLRERKEDISPLVDHFLQKYGDSTGKTVEGLTREAKDILLRYDWPGNVRELENAIERALVMTRTTLIQPEDLPEKLLVDQSGVPIQVQSSVDSSTSELSLRDMEKRHIERVLERTDWNYGKTAELLKIHRNTLRLKIKTLGIKAREGGQSS
jgi:DNA-binding NtrC family response regulator